MFSADQHGLVNVHANPNDIIDLKSKSFQQASTAGKQRFQVIVLPTIILQQ